MSNISLLPTPPVTPETRMVLLEKTVEAQSRELHEINKKLDSLLALKNKGMGAFWLMTVLVGGGFAIVLTSIKDFLNG